MFFEDYTVNDQRMTVVEYESLIREAQELYVPINC